MRLKDRVAIITGGAAGIGRAYVEAFAREGASVVIADIALEAAGALEQSLRQNGAAAMAISTDVSRAADADEMARKTMERFGRIDVLLNNAAVYQRQAAARNFTWEMDPQDWERVIAVNLTGTFLCCRAVLPYMIRQRSGKIINVASSLAFNATTRFAQYVASKGGVVAFTRALCREVGQYNINVNTLCPGYTLSNDPEEITDSARQFDVEARALKRSEYPDDLVGTAIFLASNDSDFMTGQALVVDGGNVMH